MRFRLLLSTLAVCLLFGLASALIVQAQTQSLAERNESWERPIIDAPSTWTVCSSGCDHESIQDAVDGASSGDTIELGPERFYENVVVDKDLTIRGAGADNTIIDGNASYGVFDINRSTVSISGMTITNGSADIGGGIRLRWSWGYGGAFLTLNHCIVSGNTAERGGGIALHGRGTKLTLNHCTVSDNSANLGGGIYAHMSEEVSVNHSTVRDNSANLGGGIYNEPYPHDGSSPSNNGYLNVSYSTVSGNSAFDGGGIWYAASSLQQSRTHTRLIGSTVSGNVATHHGGGIYTTARPRHNVRARLELKYCTVSGNFAEQGSAIYLDGGGGLIAMIVGALSESILAGSIEERGWVSVGVFSCLLEDADPLILPLADYGGPTWTHALLPRSPAIDAAGTNCSYMPDQRGVPRPQDGNDDEFAECDIGAFEFLPGVDDEYTDEDEDSDEDCDDGGGGTTNVFERNWNLPSDGSVEIGPGGLSGPSAVPSSARE